MRIKIIFPSLAILFASLGAFPSVSHAENKDVSNMVNSACSDMMDKIQQQYGRSFFCQNATTGGNYVAALSESPYEKDRVMSFMLFNLYFDPDDTLKLNVHYSYRMEDYNAIVSLILAGAGVTKRQMFVMSSNYTIERVRADIKENDLKFKNKEISAKEYEFVNSIKLDMIKKIEEFRDKENQ